jgi:hypothetical protein
MISRSGAAPTRGRPRRQYRLFSRSCPPAAAGHGVRRLVRLLDARLSTILVAALLLGACAPRPPGPDAAAPTPADSVSTVPPSNTVSFEVMPDYLAIGSDDDFVRMPMTPYTAQAFCDAFGFVLPTRKMVNDIWQAATVRVDPRPLTEARESPRTFLQHDRIIEAQLEATARGALVAGSKKDVVITSRLREQPFRVAIYGWHYPTGEPIQPLYVGHVDWYVDYSHGIRPVRRWLRVNGALRSYEQILGDEQLAGLLSDEGVIDRPRYSR